jgi:hypothetical protein
MQAFFATSGYCHRWGWCKIFGNIPQNISPGLSLAAAEQFQVLNIRFLAHTASFTCLRRRIKHWKTKTLAGKGSGAGILKHGLQIANVH